MTRTFLFLFVLIQIIQGGIIFHFNKTHQSEMVPSCEIFSTKGANIKQTFKAIFLDIYPDAYPEPCSNCVYFGRNYLYSRIGEYSAKQISIFTTSGYQCGYLETTIPASIDKSDWFPVFQVSWTSYPVVEEWMDVLSSGEVLRVTIVPTRLIMLCFVYI